jgi:hypothetical protein
VVKARSHHSTDTQVTMSDHLQDPTIVRAAIHPAIGIARVGNSQDEYFLAPEVVEPVPLEAGSYKDATGALKRQAARFRIYGYDADGHAVRELTAADADIEWTVHVANTKAAWYQFQLALDIPEASRPDTDPSDLRNATVTGAARDQLAIDPGPRTIAGAGKQGAEFQFDTGTFFDKPVYLGELRTDDAGRLLFLGGRGVSASVDDKPPTTFANNEGWHDDVSDGPVTATVTVGGRSLPVDPAWVVVAPPNYAPELHSVRTMYDLLFDVYVKSGWLTVPQPVSFARHVLPLLQRMSGLQWVNRGFAMKFGFGGNEDLVEPEYLALLASKLPQDQELRRQVANAFRVWKRDGKSPWPWPWVYGDAMNLPPVSDRQHVMLSDTDRLLLSRWVAGEFESDLATAAEPPRTLDDLAVADQPGMLDRAALTFCLADAFHPGCELTWPMRHPTMYTAPFRLRHRDGPEPSYGQTLTPEKALAVDGPLYGQSPGSLTRWMAVPWQTDTASCLSGYDKDYDPYVPTFWPARVPNDVLTRADYDVVIDEAKPLEERTTAFGERAWWLRFLKGQYLDQIRQMITDWGKLGVVERLDGPADGAFPRDLLVEGEVGFEEEVHPRANMVMLHVPEARGLDPDSEHAQAAVAQAIEASPHTEEQVTAGYFAKVDRFRDARR